MRWKDLPPAICGAVLRTTIVDAAVECSRWTLAEPIAISLVEFARTLLAKEETSERLRGISVSLNRIGDVARTRGQLDDAIRNYEEALQIASKVNATPADRNATVWLAHLLGSNLAGASRFTEAFDVATRYLDHARSLESEAGDDANILDTCAAFWETRASAAEACGEIGAAVEAAAHADALRARITTVPE